MKKKENCVGGDRTWRVGANGFKTGLKVGMELIRGRIEFTLS